MNRQQRWAEVILQWTRHPFAWLPAPPQDFPLFSHSLSITPCTASLLGTALHGEVSVLPLMHASVSAEVGNEFL